jgi:hypothetical protein
MQINSASTISELKSFIASGNSFKARPGDHDDLISALLLIVRMASQITDWDINLANSLKEELSAVDMPLPFVMIGGTR